MIVITTENLTKSYNNHNVVNRLNLSIEAGKVFGFLGPNGAGKTTTIRMLLGLVKPNSGTANILNYDVRREYDKIASQVAAIVETPTFFPYLNAIQTLKTFADYCQLDTSNRSLEEFLDKCGILYASKQKVESFSLGMKQRLGIAIALINNPKVIFLDEPTNGLDPDGIVSVRRLLRSLAVEENKTIFLSSHLLNEVEQTCDEVAILDKGTIKISGEVQKLLQNKRVLMKVSPVNAAKNYINDTFSDIKVEFAPAEESVLLEMDFNKIPFLIEKLVLAHFSIHEVSKSSQTMEDFFHQIVKPN